ncbi:hypothetical protein Ddye_014094 [Dipteronia dyeriana]|uniref:KIB1-4 beta-propeller domain-containing protein n=1 Tax=Dipteronia dyeriana TaxID=168575 RepID=A0AAE0CKU3_9ROSI|nr:hypothetical protein Ddye_014094 [Dipteronia dyeriana]
MIFKLMSTAKKMKMAKKTDWSGLDDLALVEITGRMTLYRDFAAFRMVCTSWRSSLQNFKFKCRMPWLMIPPKQGTNLRELFIFPHVEHVQGGIAQQHLILPDPETRILSNLYSKGWLITIDTRSLCTNLLHPFSAAQINLPQWHIIFVNLFVLSSNPLFTLNYTVMILHGGIRQELIYSKPGDEVWTTISTCQNNFSDITYCEGKFYPVNIHCQIMACDVRGDNPTMAQVANMPESLAQEKLWGNVHIVESSGRLLVVTRRELYLRKGRRVVSEPKRTRNSKNRGLSRIRPELKRCTTSDLKLYHPTNKTNYGTYEFQVFEVDLSNNSWTRMKDLGNKTLFFQQRNRIYEEQRKIRAAARKTKKGDDGVDTHRIKNVDMFVLLILLTFKKGHFGIFSLYCLQLQVCD